MKKTAALILAAALLLGCLAVAQADTVVIGNTSAPVPVKDSYPDNPVVEGENPFTGLPASGEPFTPVLLVLGPPDYEPFWGHGDADILFLVPNQGAGSTKEMALFADVYPRSSGGSRSARMTMLPFANAFDSAFASGAYPPLNDESKINVKYWISKWGYNKNGKYYNLLGNYFKERINEVNGYPKRDSANLGFLVRQAHQDMIDKNVPFEVRPFRFADEALDHGDAAPSFSMTYFGNQDRLAARTDRPESNCSFTWQEGTGYSKRGTNGIMYDLASSDEIHFANVIVLWTDYDFEGGYYGLKNYFVGNGQADIFQNGKHITGAWVRTDLFGRLILLDDSGEALKLQRGKTFFLVSNQTNELRIEE